MGICIIEGCSNPSRAWKMCQKHFQRTYKYGDPHFRKVAQGDGKLLCTITGCTRFRKAKGYCQVHYQRYKRFGDPLFTKINPHGLGTINQGYRIITLKDGRRIREHRWVMEQHLGRPLKSNEIVHHIDGNGLNNSFDNLVVLTQSVHIKNSPKALKALADGRKFHRWPNRRGT